MDLKSDLCHLARIALRGSVTDVPIVVRRIARRYRETEPSFSDELIALLRQTPVNAMSTRQLTKTDLPIELESRIPLIRVIDSPDLECTPIYDRVSWDSLQQVVAEHRERERLLKSGIEPTRTVLFTGPPGVGKTLAAKWISRELKSPLAILDLASVMSSLLGRTGANVRTVLDFCKERDCILLLDELDAVAKKRDDSSEIGELKRLVTVLLQEIDDWPTTSLLLAATNHPTLLDQAVWRRFEVLIEFPMPQEYEVEKLLREYLDFPDESNWFSIIARCLSSMSFSDVRQFATQVHRNSTVNETTLETALKRVLGIYVSKLPPGNRKELAVELARHRLDSQRNISKLTGVSRDTIRKHVANSRATLS